MSSKIKNAIAGIFVVGLILALVFTLFNKPVKEENNIADIIKLDEKPADTVRDTKGKLHAQKEVIYLTDRQAEQVFKTQIDSLREQLSLAKSDKIVAITAARSEMNAFFEPIVTALKDSLDSVKRYEISYKSKWFDLYGVVPSTDPFKISFRDSVTVAFVEKHSGLFNLRKKVYADISSANKDMEYLGLRTWQIPSNIKGKSRIGLGVGIGPGIFFKDNEVGYSWLTGNVGIQYRF